MSSNSIEVARPSKSATRSRIARIALIALFLLLLAIGAVPHYLSGKWTWKKPIRVENLAQLKQLTTEGLSVPGWKTLDREQVSIGGHKWSVQKIQPEANTDPASKPIILLLRPQNDAKVQPEIDWVDIRGLDRWKTDSGNSLKFEVESEKGKIPVETHFFRAWNDRATFAVAQWYAWPEGGNPNPATWFAADQKAQLRGYRQPWIAISIQMPIAPLAEIAPVRDKMAALAQQVHKSAIAATRNPGNQK